jgi:hypothetical protein
MPIEDKLIDRFILGEDYVSEMRMKYPWVERAVSSGLRLGNKSVYTRTFEVDGQHMVVPTVRRKRDKSGKPMNQLVQMSDSDALEMALLNKDFIPASSAIAAEYISRGFSNYQGNK